MITIEQRKITEKRLIEIINEIEVDYQGHSFIIFHGNHNGRLWVQVGTERPCAYTGKNGIGKGGKAYVSPHATHDEIVKKIFGLCIAYAEHEVREGFHWKGKKIFNPHISVDALYRVARQTDYRDK